MVTSDRIAVMNKGRIEQVDAPHVLYARPKTRFVAGFIGRTNFVEGAAAGQRRRFDGFALAAGRLEGADGTASAAFSLRPQAIGLAAQKPNGGSLAVEAEIVERDPTSASTGTIGRAARRGHAAARGDGPQHGPRGRQPRLAGHRPRGRCMDTPNRRRERISERSSMPHASPREPYAGPLVPLQGARSDPRARRADLRAPARRLGRRRHQGRDAARRGRRPAWAGRAHGPGLPEPAPQQAQPSRST